MSLEPTGRSGEDEGYALSERLPIDAVSPEDQAAQAEMSGALKQFVDGFRGRLNDERELAVWTEHLAAEDPVPLGALGERYGVSKQRMGQIADRLKKRFRVEVVERLGGDIKTDWLGGESD